MIVTAPRASAILYNILQSRQDRRPFLLPANICSVVPLTFLKADVPFTFVDIDPATLNMDLESAAVQAQSGRFGGILYAHTYGDEFTPMGFFAEMKRSSDNLLIIDDRCLCVPDLSPREMNPADVLLYSTGYAKMVDLGSGGFAFLNSGVKYHPEMLPYQQTDLENIEQAYKSNIARCQPFTYVDSDWLEIEPTPEWEAYKQNMMEALPVTRGHRQALNAVYEAQLPAEICLPERFQLWRFNLHVKDKNAVLKAIFAAGLFASSHYISLAGIFAPGACPYAESLAAQVVNLFNDQHYTVEMVKRTCDIIQKVL